jgi:ABC-2 type transport system permease protein
MTAIWPSIEHSTKTLMDSYPQSLKEAFGIQELNTVEKYIDAEMLSLIVPLAVAYFAVRCVMRDTVGAEDRGYLDTLLSLPLSRRGLVAGTLVVTGVVVAAILAVAWALTWVAGTIGGTGISGLTLAAGFANVWPLSMAFAGIAALAAGVAHRPGTVTAVSIGMLFAMYVLDLVGKLAHSVRDIRVASLFRYYGSAIQDGLDASHIAVLVAVAVVTTVGGAVLFDRRDVL